MGGSSGESIVICDHHAGILGARCDRLEDCGDGATGSHGEAGGTAVRFDEIMGLAAAEGSMLPIASAAVPELVSVTVCDELLAPTPMEPNATDAGVRPAMRTPTPVPR